MKQAFISVIFAAGSLLGLNASAGIMEFEGFAPEGGYQLVEQSYEEAGFRLTKSVTAEGTALIADKDSPIVHSSGSASFMFCAYSPTNCGGSVYVTLSAVDGGPFSLLGLSAANYQEFNDGTIDLIGHVVGGGTVTTTLQANSDWLSQAIAGFTNLSSVDFYGYAQVGVAIDRMLVEPAPAAAVPEPGSLALLGLGLAGLSALRRRKSA